MDYNLVVNQGFYNIDATMDLNDISFKFYSCEEIQERDFKTRMPLVVDESTFNVNDIV